MPKSLQNRGATGCRARLRRGLSRFAAAGAANRARAANRRNERSAPSLSGSTGDRRLFELPGPSAVPSVAPPWSGSVQKRTEYAAHRPMRVTLDMVFPDRRRYSDVAASRSGVALRKPRERRRPAAGGKTDAEGAPHGLRRLDERGRRDRAPGDASRWTRPESARGATELRMRRGRRNEGQIERSTTH